MSNHLYLVRHGASEWNELGLWTGWTDVDLAPKGVEEARQAAQFLRDQEINGVYVSLQKRAQQTLDEILGVIGQRPATRVSAALNERHYGEWTGKNKWQVKEEIGDEAFEALRRGWEVDVPRGETLKMVHDRAYPYFKEHILPELEKGKSILVSGHGNTLRALVKWIEHIPDSEVHKLEIPTGGVVAYQMTSAGLIRGK